MRQSLAASRAHPSPAPAGKAGHHPSPSQDSEGPAAVGFTGAQHLNPAPAPQGQVVWPATD